MAVAAWPIENREARIDANRRDELLVHPATLIVDCGRIALRIHVCSLRGKDPLQGLTSSFDPLRVTKISAEGDGMNCRARRQIACP